MNGFGALYYTDCRPGQGLLGGAGFQFQAVSDDLPPQATTLVHRTALYEPPPAWMRQRRPVSAYPASLAHAVDGALRVTAAGRYLGMEANGNREGNQFTHAVVTTAAGDYGLVRPAQLWDAPWWAYAPAPTTRLEPMAAPPEPGPWSTGAVKDRIAAEPDGREWLVALLSALHHRRHSAGRPILVVADDPALVACWLAAATLLLPVNDALDVGFKIFATDLQHSSHDVVALHPDWAGPWRSTSDTSGYAVFDFVARSHSAVEPTDAAVFWVPRFFDADPFDVVDAVELCDRFRSVRGDGPETGEDRLAAAVTVLGGRVESVVAARALSHWLGSAPRDVADIAKERITTTVLATAPTDADTLRHLSVVVARFGPRELVERIGAGLLRAEIAELDRATVRLDGPDPVGALAALPACNPGEGVGRDRLDVIESALASARPDQVPVLLSLATRHGLRPQETRFEGTAAAFGAWCVDHPEGLAWSAGWSVADDVLFWVRRALTARLAGARSEQTEAAIRAHWWRVLRNTVSDPADPLDVQIYAGEYAAAVPRQRRELVREVVDVAARLHPLGADRVAWTALFRQRRPEPDEVEHFLATVRDRGAPVSELVAGRVFAILGAPSAAGFRVLEMLSAAGHTPPPGLSTWRADDKAVFDLLDELPGALPVRAAASARRLATLDPQVVVARAPQVVDALLRVESAVAVAFLAGAPPNGRQVLVGALSRLWPQPGREPTPAACRAVALAFLVIDAPPPDLLSEATDLRPALATLVRQMPKAHRGLVERAYAPRRLGNRWWDWLHELDRPDRARGRGLDGLRARLPKWRR